jgi:hypothetical protein
VQCTTCHVEPVWTEPGWNLHTADEIGIDDFQANRAPDRRYRTSPLNGLWTHQQRGFYHDGWFAILLEVVSHYDRFFGLGLSAQGKNDLVECLKSLPSESEEVRESRHPRLAVIAPALPRAGQPGWDQLVGPCPPCICRAARLAIRPRVLPPLGGRTDAGERAGAPAAPGGA